MANLTYYIIPYKMKEIAEDPMLINEAEETDKNELENNGSDGANDSVMTVCNNFITIYSFPTWYKKFGSR